MGSRMPNVPKLVPVEKATPALTKNTKGSNISGGMRPTVTRARYKPVPSFDATADKAKAISIIRANGVSF